MTNETVTSKKKGVGHEIVHVDSLVIVFAQNVRNK